MEEQAQAKVEDRKVQQENGNENEKEDTNNVNKCDKRIPHK